MEIALVNQLTEATNYHFHGFHVSPSGNSDNIFLTVEPGQTSHYVVDSPADHAPGLYWYHSHQHGLSQNQVGQGLAGTILVEGLTDRLPAPLRSVTDRVMVLKDLAGVPGAIPTPQAGQTPTPGPSLTVNNQLLPRFAIQPGETQLWRLANASASTFYNLQLPGQQFSVLAEDADPVWEVWSSDYLLMPPGKRYEVLVTGGPAGTNTLKTLPFNEGVYTSRDAVLATVTTTGSPRPAAAMPTGLIAKKDLSDAPIAQRRTIAFDNATKPDAPNPFLINGRAFDHDRVDFQVKLGTVEEWAIRNETNEWRPFHIHVNDFQVISINGRPHNARGLQDVILLPPQSEVVIRNPFLDFTGEFVFHCHILYHEDLGMMATVEVVP